MTNSDPTQRFTRRADHYARYRPTYPPAVIDCLRDECGLSPAADVADVGSGTGILTRLLLPHARRVYGVEPNAAMRAEAERSLAGEANFMSVDGRAEATTLSDLSIDLITAGQAFHWFDVEPTRQEFRRILRPGGMVALVWNRRDQRRGGFAEMYEALLDEMASGYRMARRTALPDDLDVLFATGHEARQFEHERLMDFDTVQGALVSASYAPLPGDTRYDPIMTRLRTIFDTHQKAGHVLLPYETQLYFGRLE